MGIGGKGFFQPQAGNLPVAGGGVLARALFQSPAIGALGLRVGRIMRALNLAQSQARQVGQLRVACVHHMSKGTRAHISVFIRIRQIADANGIQYR